MLLAVDVGNSNVKFGVFKGDALVGFWQMPNAPNRTAGEYEDLIPTEIASGRLNAVVIGSVVPQATPSLVEFVLTRLQLKPFVPTTSVDAGMAVNYDPPGSLGIDRLADALAAAYVVGAPCIAVDLGTATTFNVVTAPAGERPAFVGGAIAPGAGILAAALAAGTAQLPAVAFARPKAVLAANSADAVQSGLFHGYAAMIDGMVTRLREELGAPDCPAVGTGGGATAELIAECRTIDRVEPHLTLHGLRLIWEYGQGRGA